MSPFRSEKQRKFMYARHPKIAKRWSEEETKEKAYKMLSGSKSKKRRSK